MDQVLLPLTFHSNIIKYQIIKNDYMKISDICIERFELQEEYLGTNKIVNSITPIVSVTIPTYQHVKYIEDCLDSILMQKTSFPFEIIIGEDGSTDGTKQICIKYAKKYPDKIRLFMRDRNISQLFNSKGKLIARFNDVWIKLSARGKYIAWCDGDDYWTDPLKLQIQVDFLENNKEYVLCFHNSSILNKENIILNETRLEDKPSDFSGYFLQGGPFIPVNTVMYRNVIKKYPDNYFLIIINYDTMLFHLLGFFGDGKFISNIGDSIYRIHEDSLWSSSSIKGKINNLLLTRNVICKNLTQKYDSFHPVVKDQKKRIRLLRLNYVYQQLRLIPIVGQLMEKIKIYTSSV